MSNDHQRKAQIQANSERTLAAGLKPGPSGMPMQHFVQADSRKTAFDRAQSYGHGRIPVHDTKHQANQQPHFHSTTPSGDRGNKNTPHFGYSPHTASIPSQKNK